MVTRTLCAVGLICPYNVQEVVWKYMMQPAIIQPDVVPADTLRSDHLDHVKTLGDFAALPLIYTTVTVLCCVSCISASQRCNNEIRRCNPFVLGAFSGSVQCADGE